MPIYDAASKTSTDIDLTALLSAPVRVNGEFTTMQSQLGDDATLMLFVRNGA